MAKPTWQNKGFVNATTAGVTHKLSKDKERVLEDAQGVR
jgi:hypothetical protein